MTNLEISWSLISFSDILWTFLQITNDWELRRSQREGPAIVSNKLHRPGCSVIKANDLFLNFVLFLFTYVQRNKNSYTHRSGRDVAF